MNRTCKAAIERLTNLIAMHRSLAKSPHMTSQSRQDSLDDANAFQTVLTNLAAINLHNQTLETKLKRLGSMEAFTGSRSIDKDRDAELLARIDYARAPTPNLMAALEGFDDDYMTSETHHPGYVLIPTDKFERIRTALAENAEAVDDDPHEPCDLCGEEHPINVLDEGLCPACGDIAPDVTRLVIAARIVSFEDQSPEAMRELDQATEAFASRVGWKDEPTSVKALGEGDAG
jgi:hypothetical protein